MASNGSPSSPRLPRRRVLQAGAASLAVGGFATRSPALAAGFDWQRYKGERLEVYLSKSPRGDMLLAAQREFEELTGMRVSAEQVPEQQFRQKFTLEFASGHPSFDVVNVAPHVQKAMLAKTNWLQDLRPMLADPSLTSPDFDIADFAGPVMHFATYPNGRMEMIIQNADYQVLFWNKEIFAAKGVAYPRTWAEQIDVAKALHDPARGIYGYVGRGLKNANTVVWAAMMLGWDLYGIDPDLTVHTTEPGAVAAAQIYQTLMRNYAPDGSIGFNWYESQNVFAQGHAAMWLDSTGFAQPLEDPTRSKVVGKVGYGIVPPGPKAQWSGLSADAMAIPAACPRKGAAWLYIQWACGKEMMARQLISGAGAPPRESAYLRAKADPTKNALPLEWLEAVHASALIARPHNPQIVAVTEYRDIFGIALTNMILGADPATELANATKEFQPILERTEHA
jgi:multiple sugar transport system substrate-binding protein